MHFSEYTNKDADQVLVALKSSRAGLSKKAVAVLQKRYGFNEIATKGNKTLDIFLRQCKSPFFYLIFFAAGVSFLIGEKIDGFVITVTGIINVAIGVFQEYRAEKSVSLLKKFIPQHVKVLRNNKKEIIEKKLLVVGDIVILEAGDIVPADLRIIELENLLVDESVLTGESVPVGKSLAPEKKTIKEIFQAHNIAFTGTSIIGGKAKGVVVAIGRETAFGEIASLVSTTTRKSAYEKNIIYFCRLILRIVVVTIAVIFVLNIWIKGFSDFFNLTLFSVALIISILPEALPAVVTFALSKGSIKMAKNHVVVQRLSAIEDLGNIEILCTDKTGTLTENKLSLEKIVSSDQKKCLQYALINNDHENKKTFNPFDAAIKDRAFDAVLAELKKNTVLAELPFDSLRMRSSMIVQNAKGEKMIIVKGAPEIILKKCSTLSGNFVKKEIQEEIAQEGLSGKRVLGIAFKKIEHTKEKLTLSDEKGLTFLGYFVFTDPLKKSAEEAIRLAKKMGVQIKIITGDSREVSGYVAREVGLIADSKGVMLGEELDKMLPDDFDQACQENVVFARVSPQTKHAIIKSLQKHYEVGFLGEGINDAPALKIANVAIAVPSASDISREVSDVVMLQKDLRVIIEGIKEGRVIFSNINKYIKCTLASNFGNFYSIAAISLFINYLPMLPVQILLGNLMSDFPLVTIATDSVDVEELRKPKAYQLHMMLPLIIALALVSTVFDLLFFTIFRSREPGIVQTLWFVQSMLTELVLVFIVRTRYLFWKAKRPNLSISLFTLFIGILTVALPFLSFGQELFHFVAPSVLSLLLVCALVVAYFILSEIVKLIYFHYFKLSKETPIASSSKA